MMDKTMDKTMGKIKTVKKISALLIAFAGVYLIGCSGIKNVPEEDDILSDLLDNYQSKTIECAESVEIVRSQLFEDDKKWTADIVISAVDDYADMSSEITVVYDYFDDQGWIINKEETLNPAFAVNKMHSGMNESDMKELLFVWAGDGIKYADSYFNSESGLMYIDYEQNLQESSFFDSSYTGQLICQYYDTDTGWRIIDDHQNGKEYSLRIQNVLGKYEGSYDGGVSSFSGDYVFEIKEISPDGKSLIFSGYSDDGDVKRSVQSAGKQVIMYQNKDYHAEFEKYTYDEKRNAINASYKITDLEVPLDNEELAFRTSINNGKEYPTLEITGWSFFCQEYMKNYMQIGFDFEQRPKYIFFKPAFCTSKYTKKPTDSYRLLSFLAI